jgi:hypothetical protein
MTVVTIAGMNSVQLAVSLFRAGVYSVNLHDVTEVKISEESWKNDAVREGSSCHLIVGIPAHAGLT